MKESYMTHKENGQPDFLFLINAEIEKVESTMRGPFADTPAPCFELPVSLPAPSDKPRKHPHLKASTFTDLSISVDLLSRPVRLHPDCDGVVWMFTRLCHRYMFDNRRNCGWKKSNLSPTRIPTIPATLSAWSGNQAATKQTIEGSHKSALGKR